MVSLVLYLLVSWPRMIVIFLTRAALQIWTRRGSSSSSQRSRQSLKKSRYLYLPSHVIRILTRDDHAFSFLFHSSCVMSLLVEPRSWAPKCVQCSFSSPFFKIQSSISILSCFQSYEQIVVKMFPHQTFFLVFLVWAVHPVHFVSHINMQQYLVNCAAQSFTGGPRLSDIQLLYNLALSYIIILTPNPAFMRHIRTLYELTRKKFWAITQWHCKPESQTVFCVYWVSERLIPVDMQLKVWVCGYLLACLLSVCCKCCVFSGIGLCDGPITRPEESYWVWYVRGRDYMRLLSHFSSASEQTCHACYM